MFPHVLSGKTYQTGSGTKTALSMSDPGGKLCRHGLTSAHTLNALATGPNVAAIMGKAELANQ